MDWEELSGGSDPLMVIGRIKPEAVGQSGEAYPVTLFLKAFNATNCRASGFRLSLGLSTGLSTQDPTAVVVSDLLQPGAEYSWEVDLKLDCGAWHAEVNVFLTWLYAEDDVEIAGDGAAALVHGDRSKTLTELAEEGGNARQMQQLPTCVGSLNIPVEELWEGENHCDSWSTFQALFGGPTMKESIHLPIESTQELHNLCKTSKEARLAMEAVPNERDARSVGRVLMPQCLGDYTLLEAWVFRIQSGELLAMALTATRSPGKGMLWSGRLVVRCAQAGVGKKKLKLLWPLPNLTPPNLPLRLHPHPDSNILCLDSMHP
ncbi:unnamed protein product [Chrysoparadoxa australica]